MAAQYAVSAALGKDQTAYHVVPMVQADPRWARDSYQAANSSQHFDTRFDAQGASIVSAGMHWNLSVREWGYGDSGCAGGGSASGRENTTVAGPFVSANRVEYRRGALTEWYVNGPLGLQQGFTVAAPPARLRESAMPRQARHGPDHAPLTLVLNLPAGGGHSQVDANRTGLSLMTDKNEPALRYSGLTALDADGRRLPAWLETRRHDLLLRVDDTGARYPLVIDPFVQQAKLTAVDGAAYDYFGRAVALSSDGDTAIVGAYEADVGGNANRGAAYVFTRSGVTWSEQEKLIAADGAMNDYFGRAVALSSDGDTAIVGAYAADVGTNLNQGAAYVFTRSGAVWTQQEKLTAADGAANDEFGISVALNSDGDTACAGAYQTDVGGNANQGAAYMFTRSGVAWSEQEKLIAADGAAYDYFGRAVALSSDGDTAIAGAYEADVGGNANRGAAYVFTRSGVVWSEQKKLIATGGAVNDYFGRAVALSSDGDTAIAGAYSADVGGNTNQGAAYVFTRSGTAWTQQEKLTAADGAASDYFGYAVALSGDGDTAIVGAYQADVGGNTNQGAAYVFTRSGAAWSEQEKLTAADGAVNDYFGRAVALSGDGNTVIAGAYQADVSGNVNQGAAYVFAVPPPPTGVAASYDFYIDRVRVTWHAAAGATGYEVWRGTGNDTSQATRLGTGISGTSYDDMAATAGTPYYYWVKTTNASGTSVFSASAMGKILFGPDVRLNGAAGPVTVAAGIELVVTVSLNPTAQYTGYPMDWWVAASTPFGLYFLNSSMVWTKEIGPVYQGGLFGLQSAVALDTTTLPTGTYTFYFGLDTLNGSLDSDVIYDSATATIVP